MTVCPDRVVVISDFSRALGGASKLALLLAERLAKSGIPVTVFAGDKLVETTKDVEHVNLDADALLRAGPVKAAIGGIWNTHAKARLAEWIENNDTSGTIYHVHGFMQTLSPSVFAALKAVRHRTVIHAHDYFTACPNGAFFDYRKAVTCSRVPLSFACVSTHCDKRNYPQKLWRVARQSTLNTVLSTFRKDAFFVLLHADMTQYLDRGSPNSRTKTVANPAEAFLPVPIKAAQNDWFCYVGDIHDYKGVHLFAKAAKQAGVPTHFIGDGQEAENLRTSYPQAHFHGWQNREGLRNLLKNARAVVVPSRGPEPFGLTCVEAMLSGIPVVASDSILLSQSIEKHKGGMSFEAGNAQSLAAVINKLASDDQLVAELSHSGPNAAEILSTSPKDWVDQMTGIYQEMLSRGETPITSPPASNSGRTRAC